MDCDTMSLKIEAADMDNFGLGLIGRPNKTSVTLPDAEEPRWYFPLAEGEGPFTRFHMQLPGRRYPVVSPDGDPHPKDTYSWGVHVDASVNKMLRINYIEPVGLIAMWNRLHPELRVKTGDWITAVCMWDTNASMLSVIKERWKFEQQVFEVMRPTA